MSGLSGKVSLITGSAKGLGKAFCEVLLKSGARVCVSDVDNVIGEKTVDEFTERFGENSAMFVKCDVTQETEMTSLFEKVIARYGRLDIVCNNAGISNENDWRNSIDINLKGLISGTLLGMQHMRKDIGGNGGVIINVSSLAGLQPVAATPVYSATKYGVIGFSRSYAQACKPKVTGLRINILCPSYADTDLIHFKASAVLDANAAKKGMMKMGIMTPEFVAEGFLKLVEDENQHGAVLKVTQAGGYEYEQIVDAKVTFV